MDQCTHEVRAQYWRNIIQTCQQRPAGQSAKQWMDENGICEQSYYYWQRRFRQEVYQQIKEKEVSVPVIQHKSEVSFTEIPYHQYKQTESNDFTVNCSPTAVIKTAALSIAINNEISDSLLSRIIQEVSHA